MDKTTYRLKGTRQNRLSATEKFIVKISRQTGKFTAKQAMDTARQSMYQDDYDHILFTGCAVRVERQWKNIPMLEALGLE